MHIYMQIKYIYTPKLLTKITRGPEGLEALT